MKVQSHGGYFKLNYDRKVIAGAINYDCKRDTTIRSINLTSTFTIEQHILDTNAEKQ